MGRNGGRRGCLLVLAVVLLLASAAEPAVAQDPLPNCPPARPSGPPRLASGLVSPEALVLLGVLRRPPAPADRPPGLRDIDAQALDPAGARLLGSGPTGERYYLIPAIEQPLRFDARCKRRLAPRQRRRLERIERATRPRGPTLLLHKVGRDSGSTGSLDLDEITENNVSGGCSGRACERPFRSTIRSVVPDGVAAVRLRFRGGLEREVPVVSNFWVTVVPIDLDRAFPVATLWIGPEGQVVREFGDPGI